MSLDVMPTAMEFSVRSIQPDRYHPGYGLVFTSEENIFRDGFIPSSLVAMSSFPRAAHQVYKLITILDYEYAIRIPYKLIYSYTGNSTPAFCSTIVVVNDNSVSG